MKKLLFGLLAGKDLQTEKTSRQTEIAGARLAVQTQTLLLEKSKLNFQRVQELFGDKLVAQEVYDNARLDYELQQNTLDIARNRLENAQTALQTVEDKLLKTVIRAPFDCTILVDNIDEIYTASFERELKMLRWCLPLVSEMQNREYLKDISPFMSLNTIRLRCRLPSAKQEFLEFAWVSPVAERQYSLLRLGTNESQSLVNFLQLRQNSCMLWRKLRNW